MSITLFQGPDAPGDEVAVAFSTLQNEDQRCDPSSTLIPFFFIFFKLNLMIILWFAASINLSKIH